MEEVKDQTVTEEPKKRTVLPDKVDPVKFRGSAEEVSAVNILETSPQYITSPQGMPVTEQHPAGNRRYKILIHETGDKTESKRDVFVSCNGFACLIKRGVPVVIREGILSVLLESVITTIEKDDDTGLDRTIDVPRFSLQIMGEVT
jgi:hypothetical protein